MSTIVKTKAGVTRNVLKSKEEFRLFKEVETNYVKSGLTDEKFAEAVSKTLGITISEGNVRGVRQALEIKATIVRTNGGRKPGALGEFQLNSRMLKLEALVRAMRIELGMPVPPPEEE